MARSGRRCGSALYLDLLVLTAFVFVCLLLLPLFRQLLPAPPPTSARSPAHEPARNASPAVARVVTLLEPDGDVRVRHAGGIGWGDAHASVALDDEDAVQTFTRSRALLRMDAGDYLQLGERSLIVLGAPAVAHPPAMHATRGATLLAGAIGGTLGPAAGDTSPFELELPGARLTLLPGRAQGGEVRFVATRNPDASSSISLLAGRARLAARRGTESLASGYGVTLDAHGNLRETRSLPPAPAVLTPPGGSVVAYRDVPPRVEFRWSPVGRISRYRLRIARDPDFRELRADERVNGTSFTLSDLHAGEIYWSVSALDGGHEGRPGVPRRLRILRDSEAPALSVDAVAGPAGQIVVRGSTEEGARVYVQGRGVAPAPGGDFETRIERRPGAFLLVVEAADAVGNVSSDSRIVSAPDSEHAAVADAEAGE
jgi:hypothetical protein